MSWQDDVMADQEAANALFYKGEAEWRELYGDEKMNSYENKKEEKTEA